jgi:hypothetical protein
MLRYRVTVAALAAAVSILPSSISAAPAGLAYDSVLKFAMNADSSTQQPGDFDKDFAAAAAVQGPDLGGGTGFFAAISQASARAKSMQQLMQTGFAERHYVAGTKSRTDNLSMQTAMIIDCAARTITHLDLRHKTYKTESMDQSSSSGEGGGSAGAPAHDDGSRVAVTVNNTALGSREVGGQSSSGYRSDMKITETSASGETQTQNGNMVGYYSSYANPAPSCARRAASGPSGQMGTPMAGNFAQLMSALASPGDRRFTISQSGPPLPLGKLAMFSAATFTGGRGSGLTLVSERGNVRSISADDPVFTIPADFTQQR